MHKLIIIVKGMETNLHLFRSKIRLEYGFYIECHFP